MISNPFTKEPLHSIIIHQVKAPLVALLIVIDTLLPQPTKETVRMKNSKLFIEIRDEFLKHIVDPKRMKALRGGWNLFIIVYDYDPPYQWAIDWIARRLIERIGEWTPQSESEPDSRFWKKTI